jgi:NADH-quinone oxidoreductase subunit C
MKLTTDQIFSRLNTQFPGMSLSLTQPENGDVSVVVPSTQVAQVVEFLKNETTLGFDYLMNLSACDTKEQIEVTYHLHSYTHRHSVSLKVVGPRTGMVVATLAKLYGAANFQEREVFDHFGVKFLDHPDMRRILLPDDWVGFPLLKDYQELEDYNGIGTTRPSML